ncbi:MAG: MurR/RpiR family transcriptional regulator [Thiolinea sp.]
MSKAKAANTAVPQILPDSVESLHTLIVQHQDKLSARLKVVAAWLVEHPQQVPLSTLAEIATEAGVHASTLVRFANYFGFDGFSGLQKLYKSQLMEHPRNYRERISQLKQRQGSSASDTPEKPVRLLEEFTEGNLLALELLRQQTRPEVLDAAVQTLNAVDEVFLCGLRRMYPVATYFHYTLSHLDVRCHLIDGNGGMEKEQISWAGENSALIAITFNPYTPVTAEVVHAAAEQGCKIILITDSELCPLAGLADHLFVVREAEVRAFRSLNSTLCLAQTLCVALGYERQLELDQ